MKMPQNWRLILARTFGFGAEDIICHSEGYTAGIASNHADVMHWFPLHGVSMDDFRRDVKSRLEDKTDEDGDSDEGSGAGGGAGGQTGPLYRYRREPSAAERTPTDCAAN